MPEVASMGASVSIVDFDRDGWPDIYVACDSTPSLLFMNNKDGTFREEGLIRAGHGLEQAAARAKILEDLQAAARRAEP